MCQRIAPCTDPGLIAGPRAYLLLLLTKCLLLPAQVWWSMPIVGWALRVIACRAQPLVALSTRRLQKRGTIKVREAVLGAGSRTDANVRLHRWAPNSVQKVSVIHSVGLHACGRASATCLLATWKPNLRNLHRKSELSCRLSGTWSGR